jgi:C_GCAxxG_C_C family probable redox protein
VFNEILKMEIGMNADEKAALLQRVYEKAAQYELDYGACPQCVLATIQETIGGIDDSTIKAVHGLAGGGGLMAEGTCGALTGGLVALSAKYGRDRDKLDKGRYLNNFKKCKTLVERFRAEFGGVTCSELQKQFTGRTFDMWEADQYQAFDDARGTQCANATGKVTQWVVEMLQQ